MKRLRAIKTGFGIVKLWCAIAILAPTVSLGGPLSCLELEIQTNLILSTQPERFLSQQHPHFADKDNHWLSPTKGNMLCGPTCLYNLEQITRTNLGLPMLDDPRAYMLQQYGYLKDKRGIDLREGLYARDLAELFGHAMMDATQRPVTVSLKSIFPQDSAFVPWVSNRFESITIKDLPMRQEPGMSIVMVTSLKNPNRSHYLVALRYHPKTNRLFMLDPDNPSHTWWSTLAPFQLGRMKSFQINVHGEQTYIQSVISLDPAK